MISRQTIQELIGTSEGNHLTITFETHRKGEEVQQNPMKLKNLIRQAKKEMTDRGWKSTEADVWLKEPGALLDDLNYWNHADRGWVYYRNEEESRIFQLPYPVQDTVYLKDHFLVTPLLPMVSLNGTWHVLAISQKNLRLLRCTREEVIDVTPDDIFTDIEEFFEEKPEVQIQFHTGAGGKEAMFFGHGGGDEDKKNLTRKYLHGVEESVTRQIKMSGDPLLIAATGEVDALYRSLNKYPRLLEASIQGYPGEMSEQELRDAGWEQIREHFLSEMYQALDQFDREKSELISNDLTRIVQSTVMGQTDTLFIAMGEERWGRYDGDEHTVHYASNRNGRQTELLNWTAMRTIEQGGNVFVLPKRDMPASAIAAALFRF